MIGTIIPMVYGAPDHKRGPSIAAAHLVGAVVGASLLGAFLGSVGLALQGVGLRVNGLVVVAICSLVYATHELGAVRLPTPELHRQVPAHWRSSFSPPVAAGLYGLALGAGVVTHITTATFYVVCVAAVALGDPIVGAIVLGAFGFGRGLPVLLLSFGSRDIADAFRRSDRVARWDARWVHVANGQALCVVGAYLLALST